MVERGKGREATSLSEATQRDEWFERKDLSVKQQTIIKYKAIRKAAKATSSHNIHLFTLAR